MKSLKRYEFLENANKEITEKGKDLKSEIKTLRREYARLKQLSEEKQVELGQDTNFGREFE